MNYIIHTYFNSDQVATVLRAVVMLVGSGGTDGDYAYLIRTAAMIGLFMATCYGFVKARGDEAGQYMIMVALFYSTLFVPRVTVTVQDHGVGVGAPIPVDHVPIGLAFFASTTSHIGYWLTDRTETFFSYPDTTLQLNGHGLMGGTRSLRLAQSASIKSPILLQDTLNFMKECINPELINQPSKIDVLAQSTKIWSELSSLSLINPGRMVYLQSNGTLEDCRTAYTSILTPAIASQASSEMGYIAKVLSPFTSPAVANAQLASMLPAAEGLMMGASFTAVDSIKQRMLINLFQDGPSSLAAMMNDPSSVQIAQGSAMASSMANNSYLQTANMAKEAMPLLRNAIELVVISIFPIMLVLIIIAGNKGGTVLRSYVMTLMWVQLWAPLYAIVNFVGTMAAARSVKAVMGASTGASIANAAAIYDGLISSEAVAGMLTIAVPLLALAIVKGGEMAMTGLTSSIMGPAQSAATSAGSQVALGNTSMGNYSVGNISANNRSANNSGLALKYTSSNAASFEMPEGTTRAAGVGSGGPHAGKVFAPSLYTGPRMPSSSYTLSNVEEGSSGKVAEAGSNHTAQFQDTKTATFTQKYGTGSEVGKGTAVGQLFKYGHDYLSSFGNQGGFGNQVNATLNNDATHSDAQSLTSGGKIDASSKAIAGLPQQLSRIWKSGNTGGGDMTGGNTPSGPIKSFSDGIASNLQVGAGFGAYVDGSTKTSEATSFSAAQQRGADLFNRVLYNNGFSVGGGYADTGKEENTANHKTAGGTEAISAHGVSAGKTDQVTAATKEDASYRFKQSGAGETSYSRENSDDYLKKLGPILGKKGEATGFDYLNAPYEAHSDAAKELGGVHTNLDGKPMTKPNTVGAIQEAGMTAVQLADAGNKKKIEPINESNKNRVNNERDVNGAPNLDMRPDYKGGRQKAEAEMQNAVGNYANAALTQAENAGATRLASAMFSEKGGTGRLLASAFLDNFIPGLKVTSTPEELRQSILSAAQNNSTLRPMLRDIGNKGNLTSAQIEYYKTLR